MTELRERSTAVLWQPGRTPIADPELRREHNRAQLSQMLDQLSDLLAEAAGYVCFTAVTWIGATKILVPVSIKDQRSHEANEIEATRELRKLLQKAADALGDDTRVHSPSQTNQQ